MTSEEKQAALNVIMGINAVEGFDPTPLAVEYVDLNTNEKRLRLPPDRSLGHAGERLFHCHCKGL